jgi:hypothetical protein
VRRYILFVILAVFALQAKAQYNPVADNQGSSKRDQKDYLLRRQEDGNIIYDHQFSVGGRLNTDGWGAFLELGHRKNNIISTFYQIEAGETKSPKEEKSSNPLGTDVFGNVYNSRPYVYGKENIFYQVKLSIGQQYLIGGKGNKNGVEVSAIYMGGISLGLLRPYYLQVFLDSTSTSTEYIKYTTADQAQFLDSYNIVGGTGLSKGWNELQVVPGLHARLGFRFDWAALNSGISAIEVSVDGQYYTKKIPIMVEQTPQQFFLNASVALMFGKRW